jgi:hypothetical protein
MQHERLHVRPKFGDDERNPMRHQAGNEMDVSAQPIELGNRDGAFTVPAGLGERGGELRPAIERVSALAGFDLNELLITRATVAHVHFPATFNFFATA